MKGAPRLRHHPPPGPADVLALWRGHWYRSYGDRAFDRVQRTIFSGGFVARRMEVVSLRRGGELLAGAKLYRFPWILEGRRTEVAGVGAVIVPKELRGRGYGQELMRQIRASVRRSGLPASVLHSDIAPRYYRRLGYRSIGLVHRRALATELAAGPGARGADLGKPADRPLILDLYRRSLGSRTFGIWPDASFVRFKLALFEALHELGPGMRGHPWLLVSRRRGAFVLSRRVGKELDIALWGGPVAAVHALVRTLVAGDPERPRLTVHWTGPRADVLDPLFPRFTSRKDDSTMIAGPADRPPPVDPAGAAAWSVEGF